MIVPVCFVNFLFIKVDIAGIFEILWHWSLLLNNTE